ncbi:surface lipoprotein assembly modifier [Neisseria leonii]|uniref:Surface lipoprotein assembly modifier n=1 Tax=Neisseria leonii TaxID=2995413 RepID=A0A9X4E3L5_9NEIS|nr:MULTISPECIES: surface lipoprotein assembly modifier [unclassified Neisseria]MDD9326266.1 surface lipoprotein assembly modifier [Neisseria sp. 3986]MDD9328604.1 surface lipoprotein assembly modifier [Neisseria sp. 51.81]
MKKLFSLTLTAALSCHAYADDDSSLIADRLNDQRAVTAAAAAPPAAPAEPAAAVPPPVTRTLAISKEELARRPELVVRALMAAVVQNNRTAVDLVYPLYQALPAAHHDPQLTLWAQAVLARQQGDLRAGIAQYRRLLAETPELTAARLQLAAALFEDNQTEAAEDQFQKLRTLPDPNVRRIADTYLDALARRDRWTLSGSISYLNDPNINNAPKSGTRYGNWHAPETESAQGIGLNLNLGKKWSWGNGFYNELRIHAQGKYYWDNRKYNDAGGRASLGIGFRNAKWQAALLPFAEQSLYAGGRTGQTRYKRFYRGGGATLEGSYWLSPQWQFTAGYEQMQLRYASRRHLNGGYRQISGGIHYLPDATRLFFANLHYNRTDTRDRDDSFIRKGITAGWGQEWEQGLSTHVSLGFAQKHYQAPMPVFGITQRNREWNAQAAVWHRAFHFKGITPRLTYGYNRVQSNHSFYSYAKHRVFVDFSKRF